MATSRCTFCGEANSPGRRLLAGLDGVAICRDCAELAATVLAEPDPVAPDLVLTDISTLLTLDERYGGLLGPVSNVSLAVRRGRVVWFGAHGELPRPYRDLPVIDCGGRLVMPGFVDAGASLLGEASVDRPDPSGLSESATVNVRRMAARGTTSLNLAVGGSADPTAETLRLAVARSIDDRLPVNVVVGWRCGVDLSGRVLTEVMMPTAARLADLMVFRCDGTRDRLRSQVSLARNTRRVVECHEPEPNACLELIPGSIAVHGVPAGTCGPGGPVPAVGWWEPGKARNHWSAGERPALVTSSDPDQRLVVGMGMVLMAAVDLAGLPLSEAIWSVTRAGAQAIGDGERGWIHLGGPADLVVVDGDEVGDLLSRPDFEVTWTVVAGGVELGR